MRIGDQERGRAVRNVLFFVVGTREPCVGRARARSLHLAIKKILANAASDLEYFGGQTPT